MQFTRSEKLPGVVVVRPDILVDPRGDYCMVFNDALYTEHGIKGPFVEHCISTSKFGTLRGLHADPECDKLIQCLHGEIWYCLVDTERAVWEGYMLTDRNRVHYPGYATRA